jgi:hypothetical protein
MSKHFQTNWISTPKFIFNTAMSPIIIVILVGHWAALLGGRHTESLYRQYNAPLWLWITTTISLINICNSCDKIAYNIFGKRGLIVFKEDEISINHGSKRYKLNELRDLTFLLDSTKYKPEYNRDMLGGNSNNWVKFKLGNRDYKYEFAIKSKVAETEFMGMIDIWKEKNLNIKLDKSTRNFWQKMFTQDFD